MNPPNPYQPPHSLRSGEEKQGVTIKDIDIPFGRLVSIMLKTMLASIPAMVIFYLILGAVFLVFAMFAGGIGAVLQGLGAGR